MCQFSSILLHYYWKEVSKIQSLFNKGSWFHPESHPQKLVWNRSPWTKVSKSPGQFLASLSFFIYLYYTNVLHVFFSFFFFWFFLCKAQHPFTFSALPFLFCSQLFCQSSCCLHCWSAPQVSLSPWTIPFLSQHPFWVFEIILPLYFPSSVIQKFGWNHSMVSHVTIFSPSYPLLYCVPWLSIPLLSSLQRPTVCPFIFLGSFLVEVPLSLPITSTHHFQPSCAPSLVASRSGIPIQQCSITLPCLSSCFDGHQCGTGCEIWVPSWGAAAVLECWHSLSTLTQGIIVRANRHKAAQAPDLLGKVCL